MITKTTYKAICNKCGSNDCEVYPSTEGEPRIFIEGEEYIKKASHNATGDKQMEIIKKRKKTKKKLSRVKKAKIKW